MEHDIDFTGLYEGLCYQFIRQRRAEGVAYKQNAQFQLRKLARALEDACPDAVRADRETVEEFVARRDGEKVSTQRARVVVARQFTAFLAQEGFGDVFVLPEAMKLPKETRPVPYIFSEEEISRVLRAADDLKPRAWAPLRGTVISAFVRVLYSCGTRMDETAALTKGDVDFANGILCIRHAKNGRSRYVPMSPSMASFLADYVERAGLSDAPPDAALFPKSTGERYSRTTLGAQLSELFASCGILTKEGFPPNPHSLRHTFAVRSLEKAMGAGVSDTAALPTLAAYMGHRQISDTEYYLQFTDASRRRIVETMADIYASMGYGTKGSADAESED